MRPHNRHHVGDRLKLHLRVRTIAGQPLRILGLRPGLDVQFATNFFHGTWHILSDRRGALLLARLLWGLAFQRRPGTAVLIDAPFLVSNPFDGDPSDAILLVPAALTGANTGLLRGLQARRRKLGPSDRSVRWQTHGLERDDAQLDRDRWRLRASEERVERRCGFVIYRADPLALRVAARCVGNLAGEMDYAELADWGGEVQIFDDFRARVGEAKRARRERGLGPGRAAASQLPQVWPRSAAMRQRRLHR